MRFLIRFGAVVVFIVYCLVVLLGGMTLLHQFGLIEDDDLTVFTPIFLLFASPAIVLLKKLDERTK